MVLHLIKLYVTYRKLKAINGKIYIGKASGFVKKISREEALRIVRNRDYSHHKNKDGFEDAELDLYSEDSDAIRGHEDILIRQNKELGISGNTYNGISARNKKRKKYLAAAARVFGDVIITYLFVMNLL